MKALFRWSAAAFALMLTAVGWSPAATGVPSSSASLPVSAQPVLDWSRYATQAIVAGRPPASSEVLLGIVHIAIADTVAGLGYGRPFRFAVRPDRKASAAAAVATATYDVLRARVAAPGLDGTYADYLAGVPDGVGKVGSHTPGPGFGWR